MISNTWLIYWCAFSWHEPKFSWHKQHKIWLKCLHRDQIYCQWLVPLTYSFLLKVLLFIFKKALTCTCTEMNEVFDTWTIAIDFFWVFPYIQNLPNFLIHLKWWKRQDMPVRINELQISKYFINLFELSPKKIMQHSIVS